MTLPPGGPSTDDTERGVEPKRAAIPCATVDRMTPVGGSRTSTARARRPTRGMPGGRAAALAPVVAAAVAAAVALIPVRRWPAWVVVSVAVVAAAAAGAAGAGAGALARGAERVCDTPPMPPRYPSDTPPIFRKGSGAGAIGLGHDHDLPVGVHPSDTPPISQKGSGAGAIGLGHGHDLPVGCAP